MSHLIFDLRDWRFILNEQLGVKKLLEYEKYEDFDEETFEMMIESMVKVAVEKIADTNAPADLEGCRLENGRVITPVVFNDAWKALQETGWMAATMSPEFGGFGLPSTIIAPAVEAMIGASQSLSMYAGLTTEAAFLIESFGSVKLQATYVEKMYSGTWGGTMCLTESQAGSAVGDILTSAAPQEDGSYLIDGGKIFISGADATFFENAVHLVLARVKGDPKGVRGISLFAVPRLLVNNDGSLGENNNVTVDSLEHKLGINGSATCQMSFGADGPTKGWIVGEACKGLSYMFQMMNHARLLVGFQGVGIANAAYQQALAYAKERKQGPHLDNLRGESVEIINHPDVRRNLMFMKAYSEGTRVLAAKCSFLEDVAKNTLDKEESKTCQNLLDLFIPIVKAYSTDKSFRTTELAMQVFGGYGYIKEYPIEQYMRDTKITSIYEGTNGIQALDLLARKMTIKNGALFMTYVMELGEFIEKHQDKKELASVIKALQVAQTSLGEAAFWIGGKARKNIHLAMLQATQFLELFGDVVVGHLLAEQAAISIEKMYEMNGNASPSKQEREDNLQLGYYAGKVDTARFFAAEVLILARSKAKSMTSGEEAALNMVF